MKKLLAHAGGAVLEGALVALLVTGLVVGTAFAAKGGNTASGGAGHHSSGGTAATIALKMVIDNNGNNAPNWGDTITFSITTSVSSPYLSLRCYQGSTMVYSADAGFYPGYPWPGSQLMPLSSPSWSGGAANCTATVQNTSGRLNFSVDA